MRVKDYLKSRSGFLIINGVLFIILVAILIFLNVGSGLIFLVFILWFTPLSVYIVLEIIKYKHFLDNVTGTIDSLDKKFLLPEVIEKPNFLEGEIIYQVLKECNKNMHENVKKYECTQKEYREYIEMWVHEVKTPIASARLIIDNNESTVTNKIGYELKKVEDFIEQVLYYSKSNDVSKDYIIREFNLEEAVMEAIRKNSRDFINKKISLEIGDIKGKIFSDIKWVEFILNQVLGNAIKYSKESKGIIKVYSASTENKVTLIIEDNGVGISERDIVRVFEKGFTGDNGRRYGKSTGMGLYLCKKLCNRLGLGINIESELEFGTKVHLVFPLGRLTNFK
jgi:signal transduction histidine kinase